MERNEGNCQYSKTVLRFWYYFITRCRLVHSKWSNWLYIIFAYIVLVKKSSLICVCRYVYGSLCWCKLDGYYNEYKRTGHKNDLFQIKVYIKHSRLVGIHYRVENNYIVNYTWFTHLPLIFIRTFNTKWTHHPWLFILKVGRWAWISM